MELGLSVELDFGRHSGPSYYDRSTHDFNTSSERLNTNFSVRRQSTYSCGYRSTVSQLPRKSNISRVGQAARQKYLVSSTVPSTVSSTTNPHVEDSTGIQQASAKLVHVVEDSDLTKVNKIIDENIDKDVCAQEPYRVAAEVLELKNLRVHRAPSPPCPVLIKSNPKTAVNEWSGQDCSSGTAGVAVATSQPNGVKAKKRCGVCFRVLLKTDLTHDWNQNLKRREKKCIECWYELTSVSRQSKQKPPNLLHTAWRRSKRYGGKISLQDMSRILQEMVVNRTSVAATLQDIAATQAVVESEEVESGYWHIPPWMFNMPSIPASLEHRVDILLKRQ